MLKEENKEQFWSYNIVKDKLFFSFNKDYKKYNNAKNGYIINISLLNNINLQFLHIKNNESKIFYHITNVFIHIEIKNYNHITCNKKYLNFHLINTNKFTLMRFHKEFGNKFNIIQIDKNENKKIHFIEENINFIYNNGLDEIKAMTNDQIPFFFHTKKIIDLWKSYKNEYNRIYM